MATYTYSTDLYTWTPEDGKQIAYTLTGEVEAEHSSAAQSQAYYDVLIQRIETDADGHTHVGKIHVEQKD